jgi:hypothetical protein
VNAAVLRRYLQPSPTLRWHPWAPLVAGALLILFVFYFGARWGYASAGRQEARLYSVPASAMYMRFLMSEKTPARAMLFESGPLDGAVHRFVKESEHTPGAFERWRDRAEAYMFRGGRTFGPISRDSVVAIAELRLREFSPASSRWQATASYCNEIHQYGFSEHDLLKEYEGMARDYTRVLGREIHPQDLAPAVPGWKCTFTGKESQ